MDKYRGQKIEGRRQRAEVGCPPLAGVRGWKSPPLAENQEG
ncbi:MAG: hypothetical protein AB1414_04610 [bacterium]